MSGGEVDRMDLLAHDYDELIRAIRNLSGYRCAEQRPFLAHVDAVYVKACALADQHRGAVERAEKAEALLWQIAAGKHSLPGTLVQIERLLDERLFKTPPGGQ